MALNYCCNPLKKPNHASASKKVREVTEKMNQDLFRNIVGQYLCDTCRRTIYKSRSLVAPVSEGKAQTKKNDYKDENDSPNPKGPKAKKQKTLD